MTRMRTEASPKRAKTRPGAEQAELEKAWLAKWVLLAEVLPRGWPSHACGRKAENPKVGRHAGLSPRAALSSDADMPERTRMSVSHQSAIASKTWRREAKRETLRDDELASVPLPFNK